MRLFILCVVWSAFLASPHPSSGGFLFEVGSGGGFVGVRTPPHVQFPQGPSFPLPLEPEFQLDATEAFRGFNGFNDGSFDVSAGLYSQVGLSNAFIAIPNGASFTFSPGIRDERYVASLEFDAERSIIYRPAWQVGLPGTDGPVYMALQYSAHGYLAPNTTLIVSMSGDIITGASHFYARLATGNVTRNEEGMFALNYEAIILLGSGDFTRFDPNRETDWRMRFAMDITFDARGGAGASWITLDPGMSTADNPDDFFPWLPAPNPVPAPSSWLLGLTGLVGLPWLRRRTGVTRV